MQALTMRRCGNNYEETNSLAGLDHIQQNLFFHHGSNDPRRIDQVNENGDLQEYIDIAQVQQLLQQQTQQPQHHHHQQTAGSYLWSAVYPPPPTNIAYPHGCYHHHLPARPSGEK